MRKQLRHQLTLEQRKNTRWMKSWKEWKRERMKWRRWNEEENKEKKREKNKNKKRKQPKKDWEDDNGMKREKTDIDSQGKWRLETKQKDWLKEKNKNVKEPNMILDDAKKHERPPVPLSSPVRYTIKVTLWPRWWHWKSVWSVLWYFCFASQGMLWLK